MKKSSLRSLALGLIVVFCFVVFADTAEAQRRLPNIDVSSRLVKMSVGEITLERINFRNQTADLSIGLDVGNTFVPVSLKDFDYRLSLFEQEVIEGNYDGTLKLSGRGASRVNLPVTVNLRSIPGVVWSAFRNRGQVKYNLNAGFTLPLYVTEKRFDKSFAGEVPLKTLVDAASILRASQLGNSRLGNWNF